MLLNTKDIGACLLGFFVMFGLGLALRPHYDRMTIESRRSELVSSPMVDAATTTTLTSTTMPTRSRVKVQDKLKHVLVCFGIVNQKCEKRRQWTQYIETMNNEMYTHGVTIFAYQFVVAANDETSLCQPRDNAHPPLVVARNVSHSNLGYKSMAIMEYYQQQITTKHTECDFIFKVDDDVELNATVLALAIRSIYNRIDTDTESAYIGGLMRPHDSHFYHLGAFYGFSLHALMKIDFSYYSRQWRRVGEINNEDSATGLYLTSDPKAPRPLHVVDLAPVYFGRSIFQQCYWKYCTWLMKHLADDCVKWHMKNGAEAAYTNCVPNYADVVEPENYYRMYMIK